MLDEGLVKRIQRGDQEAWALFLERCSDLIYGRAWEYSQTAHTWATDPEDEVAELYLFMAETVKRSLKSFGGRCKPRTWVLSVISDRRHILKAYLLHKDPVRAEVRLPKVLAGCPLIKKEIFRRLVWGLEPARIAQDLAVPESQCAEVEALLAEHSPRVYERIQANRQTRRPRVSLEEVQIAHSSPDPAEQLEKQELERAVQQALSAAFQSLPALERRVLILLYDQDCSPVEIAALAAADANLGLGEITQANQVYYLKDKALTKLVEELTGSLEKLEDRSPAPAPGRRALLRLLEELLWQQGLPQPRS